MKQSHIIHKVTIEINVGNKEKAYMIKDDINSFLTMDVFPKLEKYINSLQDKLPEQTLQIPRLTLNINEENGFSLDTRLKNSIAEQFKEQLKEIVKPVLKTGHEAYDSGDDEQINLLTGPRKWLKTFIYFLEKGYMPWWNSNENTINILEPAVFKKIISAIGFAESVAALMQKQQVRERMINQLSNVQIKQLCLAAMKSKSQMVNLEAEVVKQLPKLTMAGRNAVWSLILDVVGKYVSHSSENKEEHIVQQIIRSVPLIKTATNSSEAQAFEEIIKIFPPLGQNPDIAIIVEHYFPKSKQEKGITSAKNESPKENREQDIADAKNNLHKRTQEQHIADTKNKLNTENQQRDIADAQNSLHKKNRGQDIADAKSRSKKEAKKKSGQLQEQKDTFLRGDDIAQNDNRRQSDNNRQSDSSTQNDKGAQNGKIAQNDSNRQNENVRSDNTANENRGYHVQNAGLILIHPFISNLFKYCALIDAKTQKLTDPELCVHLLHYIATGKTNQPESNMLFEKFLCNIPLQQSISRHVKLSRKHKAHSKKVIEAVRQNWSAMKSAPPELLQNEFFKRPGKLVLNDSPTLTIERKAQDILLDRLSWGIGLVKLPWQKQFIYANW